MQTRRELLQQMLLVPLAYRGASAEPLSGSQIISEPDCLSQESARGFSSIGVPNGIVVVCGAGRCGRSASSGAFQACRRRQLDYLGTFPRYGPQPDVARSVWRQNSAAAKSRSLHPLSLAARHIDTQLYQRNPGRVQPFRSHRLARPCSCRDEAPYRPRRNRLSRIDARPQSARRGARGAQNHEGVVREPAFQLTICSTSQESSSSNPTVAAGHSNTVKVSTKSLPSRSCPVLASFTAQPAAMSQSAPAPPNTHTPARKRRRGPSRPSLSQQFRSSETTCGGTSTAK